MTVVKELVVSVVSTEDALYLFLHNTQLSVQEFLDFVVKVYTTRLQFDAFDTCRCVVELQRLSI